MLELAVTAGEDESGGSTNPLQDDESEGEDESGGSTDVMLDPTRSEAQGKSKRGKKKGSYAANPLSSRHKTRTAVSNPMLELAVAGQTDLSDVRDTMD